jgi:glycosyltransferase involved in cell wall biosynthesis
MLVENLSVPTDRRVWPECLALRDAGFQVVVICPTGADRDRESYSVQEAIEIHRYTPVPSDGGAMSFLREYVRAYRQTRRLSRKLAVAAPFAVVHAASPPDFLLRAARRLRSDGTRFIFDHHDLSPELFEARYGRRGPLHKLLLALERDAFRAADVVISTNESYRRIAIERGQKAPEDVFVVRNGPDPDRFAPQAPDESLRKGKPHLIAYVGMMGPQDGVDEAILALSELRGRRLDWHAIFAGTGDVLSQMQAFALELGLADAVDFTGLVDESEVLRILSTADVCLAPEPSNPLNDVSTMMKVAEYMSMERAIVAYDLPETRATAKDAALYATPGRHTEFAQCISVLLSDPEQRARRGSYGRRRVQEKLSWSSSLPALLAAYDRVLRVQQ